MRQGNALGFAGTVLFIAAVLGCGGPQPSGEPAAATEPPTLAASTETTSPPAAQPAAQEDSGKRAQRQQELLAQWRKAATASPPATGECKAIVSQLRALGPEAAMPLLDVLADAQETPRVKVAVADSLDGVVPPIMADRLIQISGPENEATSRACATHLLGSASSPEVPATLRKLVSDPERRVSFAAARGLALLRDPEGRKSFAAMFDAPGTTEQEKEQIGRVFTRDITTCKADVAILVKVLSDNKLSAEVRRLAVAALGAAGDPAAIPALEVVAKEDPDKYIREIAGSAAKLLASGKGSKEEAGAETSPEPGADVGVPAASETGAVSPPKETAAP